MRVFGNDMPAGVPHDACAHYVGDSLRALGEFATPHGVAMAQAPELVKGGTRIRDDGRFLFVWRRQSDGSWKMWRVIWNSIRPVGSGTNRYVSRLLQKKDRSK